MLEGDCFSLFHCVRWSDTKKRKYRPEKRCYSSTCSVFDCSSGSISACPVHPNPRGFFMCRRAVRSCLSLIQIWALRKKGGVVFG